VSHDDHTDSTWNQDLFWRGGDRVVNRTASRERYLRMLDGFESSYPDPVVVEHEGVRVVRDDLIIGTKARAAEPVMIRSDRERFVYCQPRTGLAGLALLDVAKKLDRKVTLFMPASKRISHHQACCIERGADPMFERIAAMPNLNKYAREWAAEHGHEFIPLGLKHPRATAGIVLAASRIPEPEVVFVAVSTGVLCRALQIAWPRAQFVGVAVARNIKDGERGECQLISHPLPFQTPIKELPPFPSVPTYDAKVWEYARVHKEFSPGTDVLMWNVGCDPKLNDESIFDRIDSNREWKKRPNLLELT
jgi:hypothetical protein